MSSLPRGVELGESGVRIVAVSFFENRKFGTVLHPSGMVETPFVQGKALKELHFALDFLIITSIRNADLSPFGRFCSPKASI